MAKADSRFSPDKKLIKTISIVVKEQRIKKKLTQEQLADRAGINWRYVQEIENSEKNISIGIYFALCKGLGISPQALFKKIMDIYNSSL